MMAVTPHRIEADHHMSRFYRLDVEPELFDGSSFIPEWGRIGRAEPTVSSWTGRLPP